MTHFVSHVIESCVSHVIEPCVTHDSNAATHVTHDSPVNATLPCARARAQVTDVVVMYVPLAVSRLPPFVGV